MLLIIISLLCSLGIGFGLGATDCAAPVWAAVWAVLGYFAVFALMGVLLRRYITRDMNAMQEMMLEGQNRLKREINDWQAHPKGDPRSFQAKLQDSQARMIRDALEMTKSMERWNIWVPMFKKQLATTRMQFHYQLKDWKAVDKLMPQCMMLDPYTPVFKMARMYARQESVDAIAKVFKKARGRLRYDQSVLLCALMSWIYVQNEKLDEAYKVLEGACKDNHVEDGPASTLKRNRDALANNHVKQFSNAGLGDMWYALFLEEPKMRVERRATPPGRFGRFG